MDGGAQCRASPRQSEHPPIRPHAEPISTASRDGPVPASPRDQVPPCTSATIQLWGVLQPVPDAPLSWRSRRARGPALLRRQRPLSIAVGGELMVGSSSEHGPGGRAHRPAAAPARDRGRSRQPGRAPRKSLRRVARSRSQSPRTGRRLGVREAVRGSRVLGFRRRGYNDDDFPHARDRAHPRGTASSGAECGGRPRRRVLQCDDAMIDAIFVAGDPAPL